MSEIFFERVRNLRKSKVMAKRAIDWAEQFKGAGPQEIYAVDFLKNIGTSNSAQSLAKWMKNGLFNLIVPGTPGSVGVYILNEDFLMELKAALEFQPKIEY